MSVAHGINKGAMRDRLPASAGHMRDFFPRCGCGCSEAIICCADCDGELFSVVWDRDEGVLLLLCAGRCPGRGEKSHIILKVKVAE